MAANSHLRTPAVLFAGLAFVVAACASPTTSPPGSNREQAAAPSQARRGGTITVPVTSAVPGLGIVGVASTSTGGWGAASEIYANGLITSEEHSRRPIGRLAERVPSLDDGTISLLTDGRMRVIYQLRKGVTWHDGTPFTAQDMVFSYQFNSDPGIPSLQSDVTRQMESAEATDDYTFVMYFKRPFYRADQIGVRIFWPQPRHLLGPAYERYLATQSSDEVVNLPYWTSEHIHLGPFRLTSFDPSIGLVFQAYDGYFLGRPRVDTVQVRVFSDQNALYANLLAGTVDVLLDTTLEPELGFQLREHWNSTGEGTVFLAKSAQRYLSPQMRPNFQTEASVFDIRVRAALYYALDRETLSEGLQGGLRELAAWEVLWPGEPLHEATKDALRRYAYDPTRAGALLREAGWALGSDGYLQHDSDGRRFKTSVTGTIGRIEREVGAFADYWRRIGVDAEPRVVPAAQVRNAEYRALYPSWEASASGGGDEILGRLEGPAASAQNRWNGNRGGYDDPRAQQLIDTYRSSLRLDAQFGAMKAISDFVVSELPLLIIFSTVEPAAVRKGIKALDDNDGAESAARPYGTRTRNAHLWEVL